MSLHAATHATNIMRQSRRTLIDDLLEGTWMARYLFSEPPGEVPDHRAVFTRDEFISAFTLIVPTDEAEARADELFAPLHPPPPGGVQLSDDLLDLLSLLSEDCAARVRRVTGFSKTELAARQRRLKRSLGLG
jgi:hypothetical protein